MLKLGVNIDHSGPLLEARYNNRDRDSPPL